MNKLILVITSGLAVASVAYSLNPTYETLIISFLLTCIIVSLGLWVEFKIKTNGNQWLNKFFYYLSKKDKDYDFESVSCIYSRLSDGSYQNKRISEIISNRNDLRGIDDRFRWSAPSNTAIIEPYKKEHEIKGFHQEDDWNHYTVDFGQVCRKKKTMMTGSVIKNLQDPNNLAAPFLSCVLTRKSKQLILTVEFDSKYLPKGDVVFKIKALGRTVGKEEKLEYNQKLEGYSKTIDYPRKGWQYIISW